MNNIPSGRYTRVEIAKLLDVDINDSKHFKRNTINKLDRLGYKYNYTMKYVDIIKHNSIEDEIVHLIRIAGIDEQVDTKSFAIFLYRMLYDEDYQSLPWDERVDLFNWNDNLVLSKSTIYRWTKKLESFGELIISKSKEDRTLWKTYLENGKKCRIEIDNPDNEEYKEYSNRRTELINSGLSYGKATKELWEETHTCFYYCGRVSFNAFHNQEVEELIVLVKDYVENYLWRNL